MARGLRFPSPGALIAAAAYLMTALVGVWAAYDRAAAWGRFGLLALGIGGALAIAWLGINSSSALGFLALACGLLAGAIGAYFLLAYDWEAAGPAKYEFIQQAGRWIQTHRPAVRLPEDINGNVAGSALAILIPLGFGGLAWAWGRTATSASTLALALASAALVLTASRGAWIGLAAGGVTALLAAAGFRRTTALRASIWTVILVLLVLVAGAAVLWVAITVPGIDLLMGNVAGAGSSAVGRVMLWRDGLALIRDYLITGSGLGSTMMVYSTYAILLHVGFISHAHNLFLQIALEQGLLGLAAFTALVLLAGAAIGAGRGEGTGDRGQGLALRLAALAGLAALLVHGVVDAGVYVSRLAPVVFLPLGFAFAGGSNRGSGEDQATGASASASTSALTLALALALTLALFPFSRAAFQANLGAVAQTRSELWVYRWPEWPIQDAVRRAKGVDLAPALERYAAALEIYPADSTANRRLGQIELSRGQYDAAYRHLLSAYAVSPQQRPTRQLLAESFAIDGDIQQATLLFRTVDLSQGQIPLRVWWYESIGEPQHAEHIRQAADLGR